MTDGLFLFEHQRNKEIWRIITSISQQHLLLKLWHCLTPWNITGLANKEHFIISISIISYAKAYSVKYTRLDSVFVLFCWLMSACRLPYPQGPILHWVCKWKCPPPSSGGPAASRCESRSQTSGHTSAHQRGTTVRQCSRCSSGCLQGGVGKYTQSFLLLT